jgi:hypothetical protein
MDRREFSLEATRALLGGAVLVLTGCGEKSLPTAASSPPLTDAVGVVDPNHGHTAVITVAQLNAGGDVEVEIQGTSSHNHTVTLTALEVEGVLGGKRVTKESTGSRHTHTVTFNA